MKHYNQPETNVLQVMNNSIICASGPGPAPAPTSTRGQLETMTKNYVNW